MEKPKLHNVLDITPEQSLFSWEKYDGANRYRIEGLTKTFLYETVAETEALSCIVPSDIKEEYICFRLKCMYVDESDLSNRIVLAVSDPLKIEKVEQHIEKIKVHAMRSLRGITLSFQTNEELDEYQLYAVKGDEKEFLCSTNVCVLNSIDIAEDETYYVEGFKFKEEKMVLCAKSENFLCTPSTEVPLENKPFLSVVIPVYNCKDFLPRTIDSVLLSTYKDLEIILVDDASTDISGGICDWYVENYSRVSCLHIEHGDVCKARNAGMKAAKGEFIALMDNDDLVHPLMYQRLVDAAVSNKADIAVAQTYILTYDEEKKYFDQHICMFLDSPYNEAPTVFTDSYATVMKRNGDAHALYFTAVWNKIIRADVARKVHFLEDSPLYEDDAYTMAVYSYIDKYVFVKNAFYVWDCRKRITVGTRSTNQQGKNSYLVVWKQWITARCNVLTQGNSDQNVANIYKKCVAIKMLSSFLKNPEQSNLDKLFIAMFKYYVRACNMDMEKILQGAEPELHDRWLIVKNSPLHEYDGTGEIPEEIG